MSLILSSPYTSSAEVIYACHAVLGISGQDVMSKAAFVNDLQLPFPLLADDGDEVNLLTDIHECRQTDSQ